MDYIIYMRYYIYGFYESRKMNPNIMTGRLSGFSALLLVADFFIVVVVVVVVVFSLYSSHVLYFRCSLTPMGSFITSLQQTLHETLLSCRNHFRK